MYLKIGIEFAKKKMSTAIFNPFLIWIKNKYLSY